MEGVGRVHAQAKLLRRLVGDVHLPGVADRAGVSLRHLADLRFGAPTAEKLAAQDVVELVGVHPHRLDGERAAVGLLLEVGQHAAQLCTAALVGGLQVSDDQADPAARLLADGHQQVGKRSCGHMGQVRVADRLGAGVFEVGRQFVEEDQHRAAGQQVLPRLLPRRLQGRVAVPEVLPRLQLFGQCAPNAERRIRLAAGEADHRHRSQRRVGGIEASHDLLPELWMPRQQAQHQQVVRLAAAHRLLQLEDPLARLALQASERLLQQRAHTFRDEVGFEEGSWLDTIFEEIGKIEHGVAALGVEDVIPRDAELLEWLHGRSSLDRRAKTASGSALCE